MEDKKVLNYTKKVLENIPADWLRLTTHRLDIYNEKLAKIDFLDQFEKLYNINSYESDVLNDLPTAYDYIRLGHPLSCVLEWCVSKINNLNANNVISFSSQSMPILAILRKNLLANKKTQVFYSGTDSIFSEKELDILRSVYGYRFDLVKVDKLSFNDLQKGEGSVIFVSQDNELFKPMTIANGVDFLIKTHGEFGSVLLIKGDQNENYISEIQHVRRRETIAMTPANCFAALKQYVEEPIAHEVDSNIVHNKHVVLDSIKHITGTSTMPLVASSGLSIQYAILMGLIHDALEKHDGKDIKIIVPPNCYGGTNDQARRVAACIDNVEILDLPVDAGNDMVKSIDTILDSVASDDYVPFIIAEIPTNPRVEVPELLKLKEVLSKKRKTNNGEKAIAPVFILDQTFCPNVHFLGEGKILSTIKTISFASGSKFPSGGLCTAGYCVGNVATKALLEKIEWHLRLCDNEATALQYEILSNQLPSMNQRISDAYKNTREFVTFIKQTLPEAKINFVSEELADQGFTPSVFSIDLPTIGNTEEERESHKRSLNAKLINLMIKEIPLESKFCVSYGQLKGCYWTIPATSTQGTTKEGDKDYIVRASLSPNMDLERHKEVFTQFVDSNIKR